MKAMKIEKKVLEKMWFEKQGSKKIKIEKKVRKETELEREVLKHENDAEEELVSIVTLCQFSSILTFS